MKTCSIEGCERSDQLLRKGMCVKHYQRTRKYGNPLTRVRIEDSVERFWSYVDKSGACWIWTGASAGKNSAYGEIQANGKRMRAHRFSYELARGPIPEGLVIDHKCHVQKCVRPEHLQAVTSKQNTENHSGPYPSSKTGIRGVSWSDRVGKYVVFVRHYGHNYNVGSFSDIAEAEAAAIAKRNELHSNNLADRRAA